MLKSLVKQLQRRNITPKQRVLLLVANQVSQERDGKSLLTEADIYSLSKGWIPANDEEKEEYNRYLEGWKLAGFAELDAQTTYLKAMVYLLKVKSYVDFATWGSLEAITEDTPSQFDAETDYLKMLHDFLDEVIKSKSWGDISEDQALEFVLKYCGVELDHAIYSYAFDLMNKDLKEDILALYPNAEKDRQYLEQEEIIAIFLKNKRKLTKEVKEELVDLILNTLYEPHSRSWNFEKHFTSLPAREILKKWAEYNGFLTKKASKVEAEKLAKWLEDYAKKNKKDIKNLLAETLLKWLDQGLFETEYTSLLKSRRKKTSNNTKTKYTHNEIFRKWLTAKRIAQEEIQRLINNGKLKVDVGEEETLNGIEEKKIITGQTLYKLKSNLTFVKDFKKQISAFKCLGWLALFLQRSNIHKNYINLLAFNELFTKLSKIYQTDLTYKIELWLEDFLHVVAQTELELLVIKNRITKALLAKRNIITFRKLFLYDDSIYLNVWETKTTSTDEDYKNTSTTMPAIERYYKEFKELFGEEFD